MKFKLKTLLTVVLFASSFSGLALAASDDATSTLQNEALVVQVKLTAGEIRKVDIEQSKLTIKHEALENLDMPGMTMVFKASDAKLLNGVKQGDKILFRAEKTGEGFMIVRLEQAK